MLKTARVVIVDEIHAVLQSRRGAHLALTLERLDHVCGRKLQRIGFPRRRSPIEEVARSSPRALHDRRPRPQAEDGSRRRGARIAARGVMSHEVWAGDLRRPGRADRDHRTTLITVNTRRLAERMAHQLSERLGTNSSPRHHGSLAKEARQDAEHRLSEGKLKVLVGHASLELGIDIGHVDLVCQISSPHRIATLLQRSRDARPHDQQAFRRAASSRSRATTSSNARAMVRAVRDGELDRITVPDKPLDVSRSRSSPRFPPRGNGIRTSSSR
jgi:ATP-dependent Lhr-like helicase